MKRRTLFALPVISLALLLTACGGSSSNSSSSGNSSSSSQEKTSEVYTTKITSIKAVSDNDDWKITGTTKAPDGSKVVVTKLAAILAEWGTFLKVLAKMITETQRGQKLRTVSLVHMSAL